MRVGVEVSDEFDAPSAIGQGTILGPTLFLTFFDDSDGDDSNGKAFSFADDKKKAIVVKSLDDTAKLQEDIDKFVHWCDRNGLELNVEKCKVMTFSQKRNPILENYYIKGKLVERVGEMPDLGVKMDSKLNFAAHRDYIKAKADGCLGFVKRECYKALSKENAKLLYETLVRSHLEYANVIWSPYTLGHKEFIESTQKQAVMFMHGDNINRQENDYALRPYRERCEELKLASLNRRRVNSAVLWIHKLISGRLDSPYLRSQINLNTEGRAVRNREFIRINRSRTKYGWNSPFNSACRAFNYAAAKVDPTLPFERFKKEILKLPDEAFGELVKM